MTPLFFFLYLKMKPTEDTLLSSTFDSDEEHDCSEEPLNPKSKIKRAGYLELAMGPMFSGKTTYLTTTLTRLSDTHKWKIAYVTHQRDIRDTVSKDSVVTTHSSLFRSLSTNIDGLKVTDLNEIDATQYRAIGIDEGQFFPNLYKNVLEWVNVYKIHVIVSCLDADAYRKPFGEGLKLIPHADKYKKFTAICKVCVDTTDNAVPAPFTARLNSSNKEKILVGGSESYCAMCRYHHDLHIYGN